MKKGKLALLLAMIGSLLLITACSANDEGEKDGSTNQVGDEKIQVVTTITQIGEPLSVIGGDLVEVKSLMGPGTDPHLYKASQSDIRTLDGADIIFYNGLNLEGNLTRVFEEIGKSKPVLAVAESIDEAKLLEDEDGAVDPHIWFDIDLWKEALSSAVEELKQLSPEHADTFEQNKTAYFDELDALKDDAKKLLDIPEHQRVLVTAHDAFGYFGRMHELEVVGLQGLSTEDEVGLTDIQDTINLIVERQIPAVFVESTISEQTIRSVIEGAAKANMNVSLGGELYSDAMGEAGTPEGTYIGMYRHNVDTIYKALTGEE